jgi:hypothetical protein
MGKKTQLNKSLIETISKRNYFQSLNIYLNNKTEVIGNNNIVVENIHDSNVEISSTNQE